MEPDGQNAREPAARAALAAAIASDPVTLAGLVPGRILRAAPGRIVAEGLLDASPVIVKHFPVPSAPAIVAALERELAHLAGHMSSGRTQVNRCLRASPAAGIAVLSRLPGDRMAQLLTFAPAAARARMFADAGAFILAYSRGRRSMGTFGPAHWLGRVDRVSPPDGAGPGDARLLRELRAELGRQAPALRGAAVCKAAVHADFLPVNLHADADGVYGFDIQGESHMPLSYDIARFLAWIACEPDPPAGPQRLGVAEADLAALLVPGLPAPDEHPGILPFLTGTQIAFRLHARATGQDDGDSLDGARAAARRYLHSAAQDFA
ncbi:MAG: hypothetical protein IT542_09635 [Rubellimicrobium sp.]|nr:hypothetical protein [Rubellimicrobium sp.]